MLGSIDRDTHDSDQLKIKLCIVEAPLKHHMCDTRDVLLACRCDVSHLKAEFLLKDSEKSGIGMAFNLEKSSMYQTLSNVTLIRQKEG